ncbi:MAG TPA: metal ABC transporter permease [Burkholderiaceae bacterium]|nr:metal ABC transporter permease [Burkholderiaceae bacterium]
MQAALEWGILVPAFLAGLLVLATHVPLGMQVLARGIVFIDLAIAQVAGVGVIAADALGLEAEGWAVQAAAVTAALLGAFVLTWTEKRWPERQEALIGVLFVLASCAGLLLLANNPHGGEHLKDLLVGQILWVSTRQLVVMLVVTGAVLVVWLALGRRVGPISFYALFAIAVTASVQLVGVYLVFASLIVPALATSAMASRRSRLLAGFSIGAAGYAVGLAMSSLIDLPSGPLIVLVMTALAIAAAGMVAYLKPRATAATSPQSR